ncbi:MAG: substrate-binding periplasmic protein [Bosea sp. (in: a-proteobacteria)]|uniref:substrate-binding periplasmic protein n=1 Tax=Bosea sp. (in: a-proteobacteria) TaxID=1871050 RepID=UPI001AC22F0C|nr:ABC transporter substrate-binding protein [Bosea sp. (in: a-proteobacteria)]MBN9444413.1 amino acid ABC transporter substrate-binding protein [Bosea sp. (in: a-proteobacteria)]
MTLNSIRKARAAIGGLALAVLVTVPAMAQEADHPQNEKLKVACDLGFAPFCFKTAAGEITGFTYDMSAALAKKLGRPGIDVTDSNFSAIFAGLFSKRYEMIPAPTNITKERAAQMLFSEPYMPTGLGFLVKKGGKIASLDELKGKAITVNNGSISDKWLTDNEAKYGYTIQRYNKNADAVQAVMIGRAFANVADVPVSRYVATQTPMAEVAFVLNSGNNFGIAFRKEDTAFRAKVELALECLKTDGTLAKIHEKWFGVKPDAASSTATVYPGTGAPGFEGYDATEHKAECK